MIDLHCPYSSTASGRRAGARRGGAPGGRCRCRGAGTDRSRQPGPGAPRAGRRGPPRHPALAPGCEFSPPRRRGSRCTCSVTSSIPTTRRSAGTPPTRGGTSAVSCVPTSSSIASPPPGNRLSLTKNPSREARHGAVGRPLHIPRLVGWGGVVGTVPQAFHRPSRYWPPGVQMFPSSCLAGRRRGHRGGAWGGAGRGAPGGAPQASRGPRRTIPRRRPLPQVLEGVDDG